MNEIILKSVRNYECMHNKFEIDEQLDYIACGICGEHLNPMWVLRQLANKEARFNNQINELLKKAKKAEAKNRCKCEHCKKMTKIQRT